MIRLSICIPTYNFGEFIGETLDSIISQLTPEVELIIFDGGSTDDTVKVVADWQRKYSHIFYHRQNYRGGIDRDIEKVVSLARGEYCWLFSADDIMLEGAVGKILEAITSGDGIYLCEHMLCNLKMQFISEYRPFNDVNTPRKFNLGVAAERGEYFRLARTSEAFFSFMSGPIFQKKIWDSVEIPESFRGTCWVVAGHLLSAVDNGLTVKYLNQKLLYKRGGNDSFSDKGIVNRCRIAIEGFQSIGNAIFGKNSKESFHIRRVLHLDIPLRHLLVAKLRAAENPLVENMEMLNRIAKMHYIDLGFVNWIKYTVYKISNPTVLKFLSGLRRAVRSRPGGR